MRQRSWLLSTLTAATLIAASPALSQSLQIGPDGIRVVPQNQEQPDRRDRSSTRDRDGSGSEISERQAIRIARGEGLEDVDAVTKRRTSYRISGVDRRGDDIRVDIDRQTGEVIDVR